MEMSERDDQLVLAMSNRAHVPAEIAKSSSGVNNRDAICIRKRNLKARSVAAELLEASVTNWDRSSRAVKLEPHRILFHKGNSSLREREGNKSRKPVAISFQPSLIHPGLFGRYRPRTSSGMQLSTTAPTIVMLPIHCHPDGPNGRSPTPYPSEVTAQRIKNGPVK